MEYKHVLIKNEILKSNKLYLIFVNQVSEFQVSFSYCNQNKTNVYQ